MKHVWLWGAVGVALLGLLFSVLELSGHHGAFADEIVRLRNMGFRREIRIAELKDELEAELKKAEKRRAVSDLLMTMAAPPRSDVDEHEMFSAALKPYKSLAKDPGVRKLALAVRRYRKQTTDEDRARVWDEVLEAKRECDK